MRLVVPAIESIDDSVFAHRPLSDWAAELRALSVREGWPSLRQLEDLRAAVEHQDAIERPRFVAQSAALLADGLHYEERIRQGILATRERNWHDLLNALVWLRYPCSKRALNGAQCADIARIGPRQRTRAQCALTHFDEGGAVVLCSDPALIAMWDRHDWHGLFWRERSAWDTRIAVLVFGHAILELALQPQRLLVAKCIALTADQGTLGRLRSDSAGVRCEIDTRVAELIAGGGELGDPQYLRPLPLSGMPGWRAEAVDQAFFSEAPCFRPLRPGRRYPPVSTL